MTPHPRSNPAPTYQNSRQINNHHQHSTTTSSAPDVNL
jgi:hypothetical protein